MVLDRYGARLTFSTLLIFAVVPCLMTATANSFNQLVWSSLINSILGAGFVVGVRMVADWFPAKEIGLAQGIYGGWGNFGAAVSQICLPVLAVATAFLAGGSLNWRLAIASIGCVTALYGAFYFLMARNTPIFKSRSSKRKSNGCEASIFNQERPDEVEELPSLLLEATDYLRLFYKEQSLPEAQLKQQLDNIHQEYGRSRRHWQTIENQL